MYCVLLIFYFLFSILVISKLYTYFELFFWFVHFRILFYFSFQILINLVLGSYMYSYFNIAYI